MSPVGNGISAHIGAASSSSLAVHEERRFPCPPPHPQGGALAPTDDIVIGSRASPPRLDSLSLRVAGDEYHTTDQVSQGLRDAGLDSTKLIVGFDFTRSNTWTGAHSFGRRSLHAIGHTPNPYEETSSIILQTLAPFDKDNLIQCYGFGDVSTRDKEVFCFYPNERPCNGYNEVLARYKELVPQLQFAGPTSFAPLIEMATTVVERSNGHHHVLLIIADGQIAIESGLGENQNQKTLDAIANARNFPLSIVFVGVGDGPWDMMEACAYTNSDCPFDNFQFVNFSEIMSKNNAQSRKEAAFAYAALSKIPQQLKAALALGIYGQNLSASPRRVPLPPPIVKTTTDMEESSHSMLCEARSSLGDTDTSTFTSETETCPICITNPQNMVFGCGHQICSRCASRVQKCPLCRNPITTRVDLYCPTTGDTAASASDSQDVCPSCSEKTKKMAFDCGHMTCLDCGPKLESCPICHQSVKIKIKLY